jgi:hypothetical protein
VSDSTHAGAADDAGAYDDAVVPVSDSAMQVRQMPQVHTTALSFRSVAGVVGVSERTVRRDVAKSGPSECFRVRGRDGKTYPANRGSQATLAAAAHMYRARGWTQRQIAEQFDVSQSTISRVLRQWRPLP